ncbi:MAG: AAA family ATPase, partial [Candidatus Hydrothermarchaeota archaeon]|nr:AAA family ATPase [Candidatus Hydrothermarchaeota archaeon]
AALASEFKKRVVLIDGSTITSDLGLHFGIYSPSVSLEDVLKKKVPILEAVQTHVSGVKLLLAPLAPNKAYLDLEELKEFLNELESYELILIDSCSSLGDEIIPILELCDEVLVVTNPELPAITDALKAIEVAKRNKALVGGVVLNRVRNERYELSVSEIEPFLDARVIAVVPEDAGVREGIASGNPIVLNSPNSPAAIEFKKLAAHLVGEEYIVGFFTMLRNLFRFKRKPGPKAAVKVEETLKKVEKVEEIKLRPAVGEEIHKLKLKRDIAQSIIGRLTDRHEKGLIEKTTYDKLRERYERELNEHSKEIEKLEADSARKLASLPSSYRKR